MFGCDSAQPTNTPHDQTSPSVVESPSTPPGPKPPEPTPAATNTSTVSNSQTKGVDTVYQVGVVPQWGTDKLFDIWQPLVERLSKDTGLNLKLSPTNSIPNFEKGFSKGAYDFAYMNPYHFVCAQRDAGYLPLIRDHKKQLTGILVASESSEINSLEDLKGKRVDFPSPNALGASLYMRTLLARKFNIQCIPEFVETHESVYLNVVSGRAAAGGGVRRTLNAQTPELRAKLKVIYETPPVNPHPLAYHPRVPAEVVAKLRAAFLNLANNQHGRELLAAIPMAAPGPATDADYSPLKDLKLEEFYQAPE